MVVKSDNCVVQAATTYCHFAIYVILKKNFLFDFRKCMRERRGAYRVLMGKSERKTLLGRPRRRRKDNINTDRQEMRWRGGGGLA
jgi:hypothetical protein